MRSAFSGRAIVFISICSALFRKKCHLSFVICHLSFVICHLSFVICHLSFVICHLSFVICHSSFVIRQGIGKVEL
ncbi:MAG: hypothetical protein RIG27_31700 [Coleofasciculus sp. F4-SAH-05]